MPRAIVKDPSGWTIVTDKATFGKGWLTTVSKNNVLAESFRSLTIAEMYVRHANTVTELQRRLAAYGTWEVPANGTTGI